MTHSTATVDKTRAHRRVKQRSWRPVRNWSVVAGIAVVFTAGLIGVLDALLLVPLTALLVAASTRAGRPVARSGGTVAVAVAMVVGYLALAGGLVGLAYLRLSPAAVSPVLITLQVIAMLVVALPLALPTPDERAVPVGRRDLTAATAGLLVLTIAHEAGISYLLLAAVAIALPVMLGLSGYRRRGAAGTGRRTRLVRAGAVVLFAAALAATVLPGAFDTLAVYGPFTVTVVRVGIIALAVATAILAVVLPRPIPAATSVLAVVAAGFLVVQVVGAYRLPAGPVTLSAPFAGEWYVVNGGHAEIVNNHRTAPAQQEALDIVEVAGGTTRVTGRSGLDAYNAYGEPLLAPADGTVVSVSDELADRPAGSPDPDPAHAEGNRMVIDIGGGRYLLLAHLQRHSAVVLVGERVSDGQAVARVGNSGNSDEPHLHIQVQDRPTPDVHHAGARTYPILFRDVVLDRGGSRSRPAAADLRRGDHFTATTR